MCVCVCVYVLFLVLSQLMKQETRTQELEQVRQALENKLQSAAPGKVPQKPGPEERLRQLEPLVCEQDQKLREALHRNKKYKSKNIQLSQQLHTSEEQRSRLYLEVCG